MADKQFIEETLKSHNEYRKKHGQGSLKLNKVRFCFLLIFAVLNKCLVTSIIAFKIKRKKL